MNRQLKAVPTEYKGVQYRSKSEAMFALWMELDSIPKCYRGHHFVYEPHINGWFIPDFARYWFEDDPIGVDIPRCQIIEYKPHEPTKTYVDAFFSKCLEATDDVRRSCIGGGLQAYLPYVFDCTIFFGSVYSDDTQIGSYRYDSVQGPVVDRRNWLDSGDWLEHVAPYYASSYREAILATRFDLVHHE